MDSVEWNKKEELVAEQALKHLMVHGAHYLSKPNLDLCFPQDYTSVFLPFCKRGTPQLTLLIEMQKFCYDNMNFLKVFHKIVLLLYKSK